MKFDIDEVNRLIRHRRSIFPKQFKVGEKVDDAIVRQMLENANWAPSHHATQPWRFKVYTGNALPKLIEQMQGVYQNYTLPEQLDQSKLDKIADNVNKSSHVIALCMKRTETGKVPPRIEEEYAVACAIENMYLTAAAHGVGCFWSTGGITYMAAAKPLFGLEEEDRLMGFMYIGQIDGHWPSGHRKSLADRVEWND